MTSTHLDAPRASSIRATQRTYRVLGISVGVSSDDPKAIELIDRSFGALHRPGIGPDVVVSLREVDGVALVSGPEGTDVPHPRGPHGQLALLAQTVVAIMRGLHDGGKVAIHAAAVARGDRALILSGPGGTGKTTLALALAARGWEVLSDELAALDPTDRTIHPYRRNLHVRPGTPELVSGLEHLATRPKEMLGGGIAWAVHPTEVGAGTDELPRRLAAVLMLRPPSEGGSAAITPLRHSIAVMELMRAAWASSVDYRATLEAISRGTDGIATAALVPGAPMEAAAAVETWFDGIDR